jgi:Tol biopolymer transport system component
MHILARFGLLATSGQAALVGLALALGPLLPGSGQLIYEARTSRTSDIILLDIDRAISHTLTDHADFVVNTQAVWSPDGRHLAFQSRLQSRSMIFVMEASGHNLRPAAPQLEGNQFDPVWSDDSASIVFSANSRIRPSRYRVHLQTGAIEPLDPPPYALTRQPLPDKIVVMLYRNGKWGISVYEGSWRDLRYLTDSNVRFREMPQWSSDDQRIAFISTGFGQTEIYVLNADGSHLRQITRDGVLKVNVRWRP